jgi:hypothetical protein
MARIKLVWIDARGGWIGVSSAVHRTSRPCIYGGIFDEGSPLGDERGFRRTSWRRRKRSGLVAALAGR